MPLKDYFNGTKLDLIIMKVKKNTSEFNKTAY